jgi:hypothetical protein
MRSERHDYKFFWIIYVLFFVQPLIQHCCQMKRDFAAKLMKAIFLRRQGDKLNWEIITRISQLQIEIVLLE